MHKEVVGREDYKTLFDIQYYVIKLSHMVYEKQIR